MNLKLYILLCQIFRCQTINHGICSYGHFYTKNQNIYIVICNLNNPNQTFRNAIFSSFSSDYNVPFFHLLSKLTQEQIPSHVKGTYKERGGKHTCQLKRREQKQCMPQKLCAAQYMKIFDQSSYNTEHPQSLPVMLNKMFFSCAVYSFECMSENCQK